jgi:hypothetical protein
MNRLSEELLHEIAGFSDARDIYSLALTSKQFFEDAFKVQQVAQGKVAKHFARLKDSFEPLATRLLHTALRSGLESVLGTREYPLDLAPFFANLPAALDGGPQLLISGSTMVQAALGFRWKGSDLDLFCTCAAAPLVRQRLQEECGLVCTGTSFTYGGGGLSDANLSAVSHVEGYALPPGPDSFPLMMEYGYGPGEPVTTAAEFHTQVHPYLARFLLYFPLCLFPPFSLVHSLPFFFINEVRQAPISLLPPGARVWTREFAEESADGAGASLASSVGWGARRKCWWGLCLRFRSRFFHVCAAHHR